MDKISCVIIFKIFEFLSIAKLYLHTLVVVQYKIVEIILIAKIIIDLSSSKNSDNYNC